MSEWGWLVREGLRYKERQGKRQDPRQSGERERAQRSGFWVLRMHIG